MEPQPGPSADRRLFVGAVGEVALVTILLGTWLLGWFSLDRSLDELSPGGRALYFTNFFTVENLALSMILGIVMITALPVRHRSPLIALTIVGGIGIALQWFFPLIPVNSIIVRLSVGVAVFWVTWKRRDWWWVGPVLVPFLVAHAIRTFQINARFAGLNAGPSSTTLSVSAVFQEVLFFVVVIVGGLGVRRIVDQRMELEERNRDLIAERAKVSEAAVLDERLRISRELHDVVAHHVTTMTVHAGAARQLVESSPDKATESLRHIESAGRNAVSELHQLLGFLRNSDRTDAGEDRSPTPSLRHLGNLQTSFGSKLTCEVDVVGDLDQVPSAVDVSAYRIIQESLTNTLKHSTATTVDVALEVGLDSLMIRVSDEGEPRTSTGAPGGHGIVGMRERASLHGGEVKAGPADSGTGWEVCAVLPFAGSGGPT